MTSTIDRFHLQQVHDSLLHAGCRGFHRSACRVDALLLMRDTPREMRAVSNQHPSAFARLLVSRESSLAHAATSRSVPPPAPLSLLSSTPSSPSPNIGADPPRVPFPIARPLRVPPGVRRRACAVPMPPPGCFADSTRNQSPYRESEPRWGERWGRPRLWAVRAQRAGGQATGERDAHDELRGCNLASISPCPGLSAVLQ